MVTIVGAGVERTFLQSVNKTLNKIGESNVASLVNPTKRIRQAMDAVEEARDHVYYETMWEFRRKYHRIELAKGQMWYENAADYQKMATGVSMNRSNEPSLEKYSYEKLLETWPDLRAFPPGSGVVDLNTITQLAQQSLTFGKPVVYCVVDGYVGLMPIPDEEFVTTEGQLYMSYWSHAPLLQSDNDPLGLPQNLWLAADGIGAGGLQKILEYPDWAADHGKGLRSLKRETSGGRVGPEDLITGENYNYNE